MRTFYISVTFLHQGTKYDLTHTANVKATGIHTAVALAIRETKKKYGKRFRVVEGSSFLIRATAGAGNA